MNAPFYKEHFATKISTTSGSKVMIQKVIFMVLDMFDLDLDISRSFDFWEFTICYRAKLV